MKVIVWNTTLNIIVMICLIVLLIDLLTGRHAGFQFLVFIPTFVLILPFI